MKVERNHHLVNETNNINIKIIDSGYAAGDNTWKQKNVVSPFSRLYFIESGEAVVKSANETIVMKPGYIYLAPIGHRISYSCDKSYTKLFFHFNINRQDGYDALSDLRKFFSFHIGINEVQKLIRCYKEDSESGALYIKKTLYNVLYHMLADEKLTMSNTTRYSPIMQKAIQYISSHLSLKMLSGKTIAEKLFISEATLSKYFKDEMGITLKKYIDDQIFYSIEILLLKTNWSIGKISDTFGFCDQFYFSRRFRQRYGCTPSEYRNIHCEII